MRSTAVGKRGQAAGRTNSCASLSVVVVSSGSLITAHRAAQALTSAAQNLSAQFIVVAQDHDVQLSRAVERAGAEFVAAPRGCSRAEMCDLGMTRAQGTIVAVRDDVSVGDAEWIDAFRTIVPTREVPATAPFEAVVMDTLVASSAMLADRPAALDDLESRENNSSIEIAAAV